MSAKVFLAFLACSWRTWRLNFYFFTAMFAKAFLSVPCEFLAHLAVKCLFFTAMSAKVSAMFAKAFLSVPCEFLATFAVKMFFLPQCSQRYPKCLQRLP